MNLSYLFYIRYLFFLKKEGGAVDSESFYNSRMPEGAKMEMLTQKKCVPCEKGAPTITQEKAEELKPQIPDWQMVDRDGMNVLTRTFKCKNFKEALDFTVKVGQLAEEEYHHPSILTEWGRVTVTWVTHKIKGLHENDFAMAAKTDAIFTG